jgi:nitrogen fixation protein FixH
MTIAPSPATGGLKGWHVLMMVLAFFGVIIAVDVTFLVLAYRTFPGEVSVTPYEDGIAYNRTLAQLGAQERLGWRAAAAAAPSAVKMQFRDAHGAPLRGLKVTAKLERPATETGRLTPVFHETEPGVYTAHLGIVTGTWDLSAVAHDAAGHRFEAERRLTWR